MFGESRDREKERVEVENGDRRNVDMLVLISVLYVLFLLYRQR